MLKKAHRLDGGATPRIRRPTSRKYASGNQQDSWWDIWLPRLSHFSQFGLFLFTIGTIYTTVIPLYQKAVLEEAIAQKEVELRQTTKTLQEKATALNKLEIQLTQANAELRFAQTALTQAELKTYIQRRQYELRSFVGYVGPKCSGLLDVDTDTSGKKPRRTIRDEMAALQPSPCLKSQFQESRFKSALREEDRAAFLSALEKVATQLSTEKLEAFRAADSLPERAKADPNILKPMTGYQAQFEAFVERAKNVFPQSFVADRHARLVSWNQDQALLQYRNTVLNRVAELGKLKFPISDGS